MTELPYWIEKFLRFCFWIVCWIGFFVGLKTWLLYSQSVVNRVQYFGYGAASLDDDKLYDFAVSISDDILDEISRRLRKASLPPRTDNRSEMKYGVNLDFLNFLRDYWLHEYSWRTQERMLNAFPQKITEIDGLQVHFVHYKASEEKYDKVYPILLIHGWPGSWADFRKIIPMLVDPQQYSLPIKAKVAFEVVVPCLPGFGWSGRPMKQGFGVTAAARIMAKLMQRLNKEKYLCHGSDFGSLVASAIAQMHPERIYGLHLTSAFVIPYLYPTQWPFLFLSALKPYDSEEKCSNYGAAKSVEFLLHETGYLNMLMTKPDTIGQALVDSPIGTAIFIISKYSDWSTFNYSHHVDDNFMVDNFDMPDVVTQAMIMWTTRSISSSLRFFKEFLQQKDDIVSFLLDVDVPTAITSFPDDPLDSCPYHLKLKFKNVVQHTATDTGGRGGVLWHSQSIVLDLFSFSELVL